MFTDRVMAVSQATANAVCAEYGVAPARMFVAYNGGPALRQVSAEETRLLRRQLQISTDAHVVVIVTRLRPEKGHRRLIEAMPLVAAGATRQVYLVIVGDGPYRAALEEYARTMWPRNVRFVGHQQDVAPWFALADVVAVPSDREAFGLSAIEAMYSRRPLVASRVGGLCEVVEHGESGLLVEPTPCELADALLAVLLRPALAARLAEGGFRRAHTHFTTEAMVQGWVRCYEELLGSPHAAPSRHGPTAHQEAPVREF
jgi:glycosyltransferase involved in cell wall biosynthesis